MKTRFRSLLPVRAATTTLIVMLCAYVSFRVPALFAAPDEAAIVDRLDERYQAAVKANDVAGMDSILDASFILVTGRGTVFSKKDLIEDARARNTTYEHQEDTQRTVRVHDGTAIVTALLWEKGIGKGRPFDKKLWFSDVYVRTPRGWRYVFGQASIALPDAP